MELDHYEKLESLFSKLFALLHPKLPKEMLVQVRHFFDHGEYGIALDELGGAFLRTKIAVSKDELEIVNKLADLMNMQDDEMVKIIRDSYDR